MNFSGISRDSLIGRLLRFPLGLIPENARMPILQGALRGKKWIVGSGNHGYWFGSYEYEERILFEKTITKSSVVFDVGAHCGFYTLLASELVGAKGKVFEFEPLPRNLRYLREHLRINGVLNVTVVEAAVSDKCGVSFFDPGPHHSMGKLVSSVPLRFNTVSLDSLVNKDGFPVPDYIKIDVEGAEAQVLSGAESILKMRHPTIFLAVHEPESRRESCDILKRSNYRLGGINGKAVERSDTIIAVPLKIGHEE